ncbi:hypothetical protein [Desulfogranum japonicum]|uniref:hypothetical protein n=1 Tax=Desulfogranum japonicum TaxID=231447 RepID=UPI000426F303|nr:hypothetical protein [Desulfogranum japonicum]
MFKIFLTLLIAISCVTVAGCHHHRFYNPGHDPRGPGNSENAPGHTKTHIPPGQAKKR